MNVSDMYMLMALLVSPEITAKEKARFVDLCAQFFNSEAGDRDNTIQVLQVRAQQKCILATYLLGTLNQDKLAK